MSKQYRTAIIGFGHMHVNNVAALYGDHPQVTWVGCADTQPLRTELRPDAGPMPYTRAWNESNLVAKLGIPKVYGDYRALLADQQPEIVIVQSENAQHAEIVEACAAMGATCCVEKPMAHTYSDALRMARACQAQGSELIVNWPLTWSPAARLAKELIDQGQIGRVLEVKWRSGHTGPLGPGAQHAGVSETAESMSGPARGATWWHQADTGGGAMLDYCCYGAMVSRWYVGEQAVAALGMKANLASPWGDADDNAAMLVRFPSAMALLEGSWTTWDHGVPTGPIIFGETGTLVVGSQDGQPVVRLERGDGHGQVFAALALPQGRANVAEELIHHLDTGEPVHLSLDMLFNLEAMAILDAGVRSAASGQLELVNNQTWQIG